MADILSRIETQRRADVAAASATVPEAALRQRVEDRYPEPPVDLLRRLRGASAVSIAAEFKRSSPSKGAIVSTNTPCAPRALAYARGGASIISVLTEPTWFCGSLEDMEAARAAVASFASATDCLRPAILRKDFILEPYQILEARAYGADTLLLIVSSLPTVALLSPLISYSRELGMEPLVEVNSPEETRVALAAGASLIGINNRNLRTFQMDIMTTVRVVATAAAEWRQDSNPVAGALPPVMLSLSGIKDPGDVSALRADCAAAAVEAGAPPAVANEMMRGVLIGEALMRAIDPEAAVREFLGGAAGAEASPSLDASVAAPSMAPPLFAKVCGVRTPEDALSAAALGANAIGMILVPGSPRCVTADAAKAIVAALRKFRERGDAADLLQPATPTTLRLLQQGPVLHHDLAARFRTLQTACMRARPLIVGVFMNQSAGEVGRTAADIGLDVVQLHGREPAADFVDFSAPIIKVLHVPVAQAIAVAPNTSSGGDARGEPLEVDSLESTTSAAAAAVSRVLLEWSGVAAAFLLDSASAALGTPAGGTGLRFNAPATFSALSAALSDAAARDEGGLSSSATLSTVPLLIAGGLTPSSLPSTVEWMRRATRSSASPFLCVPVGVDVSSGVEYDVGCAPKGKQEKGHKDVAKVTAFLAAVKSAAAPVAGAL